MLSIKSSGRNATTIQNRYITKTYDRINLLVSKESNLKRRIKEYADRNGESSNHFIVRAINELIESENMRSENLLEQNCENQNVQIVAPQNAQQEELKKSFEYIGDSFTDNIKTNIKCFGNVIIQNRELFVQCLDDFIPEIKKIIKEILELGKNESEEQ